MERGTIQGGRSAVTTIAELAHQDYRAMARDHLEKARRADDSAVANDELADRHEREDRPAFADKCRDFAVCQRWAAIRHREAAERLDLAALAEVKRG